jgi:PAS domain S-box-containing protein
MVRDGIVERLSLPLALFIIIVSAALVYRDGVAFETARLEASRARKLAGDNAAMLSALKDAETGQRGYLLTGKKRYLDPYNAALSSIRTHLAELKKDAAAIPASQVAVSRLEHLIAAKQAELDATIQLRETKGLDAALEIVLTGEGRQVMQEIRTTCAAIEETARGPLAAAQQAAGRSAASLRWFSVGSLLSLLALLVTATLTIGRGTAQRKALIRELEESRKNAAHARDTLDLTLRSIGDAVISTDAEGRVRFMNKVAQDLTGWTEAGANGLPLSHVFRIVNERTRDTVESPVEKVLRLGAVVGLANHTMLIRKDGTEIPIDDTAAPVKSEGGNLVGVVLIFRDITARRQAEKEIEAGRSELALTNEALKRSNTDLEQFAFAVSHDLQEPLRTIASFSELLARSGASQSEATEYIRYIQSGVNRMRDLINDLLEYSRVTHGSIAAEPVSLQEVLGETLWNLQTQIAERGALINSAGLPAVLADKRSMVQLFQNLLSNAIKYSGSRRPEIYIVAETRANGESVIHVRDNGIGIDMRYSDEIFEVFKRLHGRGEYGGTGIGLAICRRIVELHGGRIWVESQPGQGATFSFNLPKERISEQRKDAST